ncbi:hypothetical protein ACVWW7_000417 [Bradyrhizobium sp. LM6.9]
MLRNAGARHKIEREYLVGDRVLEVRLDGKSPVETGVGFVDPAKSRETLAKQDVGLKESGIDRESLLAIRQCVGNSFVSDQDSGPPVPPVRVVGCESDHPVVIR